MERLGVYIHWPYCKSKCPYCDFFSKVDKNVDEQQIVKSYLDDLSYYRKMNDGYQVESIFFGGGTPSLLKPQSISCIIDKIVALWPCSEKIEISLEANPNTNHGTLFADLRQAGINRLSLGVQALNSKDLKFLGRTHSLEQALSSIDSVQKNFDNHSIDIIYARPFQTVLDWKKELKFACDLGLKHLSLYQLTIEENTVFARRGIMPAKEETACKMYEVSEQILDDSGYSRYEVSNYARQGFECKHNLGYWQGYDYIGIGNGAVGRVHQGKNLLNTFYHRRFEIITPNERAEELLIMGLRLRSGIEKKHFEKQCGIDFHSAVNKTFFEQFKKEGLLIENDTDIKATSAGNMVLNYIIEHLCGL